MMRLTALTAASLLALTAAVSAAPTLQRMRGTVESTGSGTLTIKTNDGKTAVIATGGDTKYVSVVKSSLEDVKDGVFIGTATKGENPPTALEVVLFPEAMRGTGEGHYDWDEIVDTTAAGGTAVKSAMTNGTVKASAAKPLVKSAMTNGTVKSGAAAGGGKTLTVTYSGGKSLEIVVPPNAPVVSFEPADGTIVRPGAKVFLVAGVEGEKLDAKRVMIGKDGLTPPM